MTTQGQSQAGVFADQLTDALLAATSDAVIIEDADGRILQWSVSASRIFGFGHGVTDGHSFHQLVPSGHADEWASRRQRALAGERITVPAASLCRLDGQLVDASVALSPLSTNGSIVGCCFVIKDVSEELLAQHTLTAAEDRVRRSEALSGSGSFVIDANDLSTQWSEGMYGAYRAQLDDFDGTWLSHLAAVHADDRADVERTVERAIRVGGTGHIDHRLASIPDAWVSLLVEPWRDESGAVIGVYGTCQDITARRRAEVAVRDALDAEQKVTEELRRLDGLKDDFLATVSHELRTPLTSIRGYASLLSKQHPELNTLVEPIERNGTDMSRMVETLLDYCRLQAGEVRLSIQSLALRDVTAAIVDRAQALSGHLELVNDVPDDLSVSSDPDALQRILGNLIGNACKYAQSGTAVTITARAEDESTVISVADDGPGIPAEHVTRLFERFFQVPGATTRRGTGIGLAIVADYVERLSGKVWCESALGQGTTFFVRLP